MEIIKLTEGNMRDAIRKASEVLGRGGIVVYPTDTIYGLAVDAKSTSALARLRELKGREKKKPISIVVPHMAAIEGYADLHPSAKYYAKRFLPGALTLVLPGKDTLPEELMLGGNVGIRIPDEPFALSLAQSFGPFTATSANPAGLPTFAEPRDIVQQFSPSLHLIDLVIDAGPRPAGMGSTVVMFRDGVPYVLREGILSKHDLGL